MSDTGGCVICFEICHLNCHWLVGLRIKVFFRLPRGGFFCSVSCWIDKMMRGEWSARTLGLCSTYALGEILGRSSV